MRSKGIMTKKMREKLERDLEEQGDQIMERIAHWSWFCKELDRLDLVDEFLESLLLAVREVGATNLFRDAPRPAEGSIALFEEWPLPPSRN